MKFRTMSMAAIGVCLSVTSAYALQTEDRNLKSNGQIEYLKVPGEVNTLLEMLTKGEVYGRLRSNAFWYDYENDKTGTSADNNQWGLGGSLVYKTGFFHGIGATVGFYGTVPMVSENLFSGTTTNYGKSGKDTYHTRADGTEGGIGVLAEAYGEYKAGKSDLTVGRQKIDTILIASNDTKMVPNAFTAAVVENKDLPDTNLLLGYVMSQKLRDHQEFHSILAYEKYNENDDSGAHQGLTPAAIAAQGGDVNPEMVIAAIENRSIPNLKLNGEYYGINGFFSTVIAEGNYKIKLGGEWTLTPGLRYLKQMDDGAGAIGGAALKGNVTAASPKGYSDPASVDGSLLAARLVLAQGPLSLMAGYSKIADDGDIIAPWRGFPTGGYTRSMAQVDWIANTKNWMLKADYDFDKAGMIPGLKVAADYENMNFDDAKMLAGSSSFSDRSIFHVDALQTFNAVPNTEFKFRFATVSADPVTTTATPVTTDYASYNEYRFEINYLF